MKPNVKDVAKATVEVLKKYPNARNDDKELTYRVFAKILTGNDRAKCMTMGLSELRKLPAFSTVTRIRAYVQNKLGQYLPTAETVRQKRHISEEAWRYYLTGTPSMF